MSGAIELIGIERCDRVRAARTWLDAQGIAYVERDLRRTPPSSDEIQSWIKSVGLERLVNRRSTSWRSLDAVQRGALDDPSGAVIEIHRNPLLIRRPLLVRGAFVVAGFDESAWRDLFSVRTP